MKQTNPMAEDMFEKAREAFFATSTTRPKPNASPATLVDPPNEPVSAEEDADH
jgi:hypothetical protein